VSITSDGRTLLLAAEGDEAGLVLAVTASMSMMLMLSIHSSIHIVCYSIAVLAVQYCRPD
jgi:hypothetical protein